MMTAWMVSKKLALKIYAAGAAGATGAAASSDRFDEANEG